MTWQTLLGYVHVSAGALCFFGAFVYSLGIYRRVRSSWVIGILCFSGMCLCLGVSRAIRLLVEEQMMLTAGRWELQVSLAFLDVAAVLAFFGFRATARLAASVNDSKLQEVVGAAIRNLRGK